MVKGRVYWKSIFGTRCDDYTHEQLDKVQINNKFANWNETLEKKNGNGDPVLSKVSGEPLTEEINLFHVWRKSPCRLDFEHQIFFPKPVNNILQSQFNRWRGIAVPVADAKRHAAKMTKEELERRVDRRERRVFSCTQDNHGGRTNPDSRPTKAELTLISGRLGPMRVPTPPGQAGKSMAGAYYRGVLVFDCTNPAGNSIFISRLKKLNVSPTLYCNVLPLTVYFIGKLMY